MKKKVGIITITDYLNYGNRLQNYATQFVLQNMGFEVVSIRNKTDDLKSKTKVPIIRRLINAISQNPASLINNIIKKIKDRLGKKRRNILLHKKERSFINFSCKFINETDNYITPQTIPINLADSYDYFITGSDQIWNPHFRFGSHLDFLTFAPKEKRITFSPSFGISKIPNIYIESYKKWLSDFENLSIREKSGANIIRELTGKKATVLIDPTLMLDKNDWLKISKKAKFKPEKSYLLTYYIGDVSKKRKKNINEIASKLNLELVMLNYENDYLRYDADPGEFIDYFNSASLICTDSFHAIIFSILFEKPFLVFEREGKSAPMSSRIENILEQFNLKDRKYNSKIDYNHLMEINYKHVNEILYKERVKVMDFLIKSFNIKS